MMQTEIHNLMSNDHFTWDEFIQYKSSDPYDDYGWFSLRIGAIGVLGSNEFQLCVATPRAIGKLKREGTLPGVIVDQYDPETVEKAIRDRISSVQGYYWEQLVDQLRKFMTWEYEGMAGS